MARDPGPIHESLERLIRASADIVSEVPDSRPKQGSRRSSERDTLIRTPGGGGRKRVQAQENLNFDLRPYILNIGFLVEGVASLFEAGTEQERPGLNTPSITIILRSALELAGQVLWLLDAGIDANERVRRYFVWVLSDLQSQQQTVNHLGTVPPAVRDELQRRRANVVELVRGAKYETEVSRRGSVTLLKSEGKGAERAPTKSSLVADVVGIAYAYSFFSIAAHGDRWALVDSMSSIGEVADDGRELAKVTGYGLPPTALKAAAAAAICLPVTRLAAWNGVDVSRLKEPYERLNAVTFVDVQDHHGFVVEPGTGRRSPA